MLKACVCTGCGLGEEMQHQELNQTEFLSWLSGNEPEEDAGLIPSLT